MNYYEYTFQQVFHVILLLSLFKLFVQFFVYKIKYVFRSNNKI